MALGDDTIRFQRHVQDVTTRYFELIPELADFSEFHEKEVGRYLTQLSEQSSERVLTTDQAFLHSMSCLLAPVLEALRYKTRISRVRPSRDSLNASRFLVDPIKYLSFESYHFAERLKLFANAASKAATTTATANQIGEKIGRVIKKFKRENGVWFEYRNFVVHGPKNRVDPFGDLIMFEVFAISGHSDIWFEFRNQFEEEQELWRGRSNSLLVAMLECLVLIQNLNERLIADGEYSFARK